MDLATYQHQHHHHHRQQQQQQQLQHRELKTNTTKTFEDIPREILHLVFIWLTGTDIANIGKSSRTLQLLVQDDYLWSVMTKVRFPRIYKETLQEINDCRNDQSGNDSNSSMSAICWRDIYMAKDESRLSAAKNMHITHIKLPYWRIVHTNESIYGATAKLHSVCWFDVNGVIEGVPPGRYRVQWRMRLSLSARWNEPLDFTASVIPKKKMSAKEEQKKKEEEEEAVLSYTTPPEFYAREDVVTNTWILVTMPGEIDIKGGWGFTDVRVSHEKRTDFWKSGIELDWVRLQPAGEAAGEGLLVDYESRHTFYWRTSHGMRTSSSSHDLTAEGTVQNNNGMWSSSWCGDSDSGSVDDFWMLD
ncbi:hypothetical protein BDB00DRAFT_462166 [Zychaea mexicana]|uniref:uncharacterized protein n=1 Tax=Zychaea mexicana TaxID=64656 RepID=UPI0022FEF161|nr:uncharacterized protein BDB00DRAFT_462166 [Zychaea mexicana]KAI9492118.1 hypothetical protein BDB00DRAFT_462166 [Zychaea mexicana]